MRELSLREAVLLADLYGLTVDEMIYDQESKGSEGQKRSTIQQARLWQQLDEADRETLFRVMDVMQTKLEFQSFFKKHAR